MIVTITASERQAMLDMAYATQAHAHVPYTNFRVGACLKASSGKYYCGCNLENATFTPSICAERTAFAKALSEGEREFMGIAITCTGSSPAFPCGVCRQVMREFCNADFYVIAADKDGNFVESTLNELLPYSFGPENLSNQ